MENAQLGVVCPEPAGRHHAEMRWEQQSGKVRERVNLMAYPRLSAVGTLGG